MSPADPRSSRRIRAVPAALLVTAVTLAGCGGSGGPPGGGEKPAPPAAVARLATVDGKRAGSVSLSPAGDKVRVRVKASGLEPGLHGFHFHERGLCEPNAQMEGERMPFSTAGGHVARAGSDHGEHAGDLPPLLVADDGTVTAIAVTGRFKVEELMAGDGSAAMVHADPDNAANVPDRYIGPGRKAGPDSETLETGDSGDRVACGRVERP